MRVGRAFFECFIDGSFYLVTIAIVDSYATLEVQKLDRVRTRSKDRTYSTLEEINCWEPCIPNAIIEDVIICAARRHRSLWADTVVLL